MPSGAVQKVRKEIEEDKMGFLNNPEVKKLQDFYEEMKRLGLVKKQEYELPQLDTVGASYYNK